MSACDCLFVFPPGGEYDLVTFSYALGSGYIIAHLRAHGISASQFCCDEYLSVGECAAAILRQAPRIVGFTVFNTNFAACLLIAEKIKSIQPGALIVFGGPAASQYTRYIAGRCKCVDICVRNEGEEVVGKLYPRLAGNHFRMEDCDLRDLRGITYRQDGKIRHNRDADILVGPGHFGDFLDKYPSPYLSGVIPPENAWMTGIVTARGCNQNCIYCNCAVLSKRKFYLHSVDRVVAEIDYLAHHLKPHQLLNIFDDAFTLVPSRAKQICRAIVENRIQVKLGCITRCDCVDEELLDLMKAAGFLSLGFSLESAVPRILRIVGKVKPAEDVPSDSLDQEEEFVQQLSRAAEYAKKIGIPNIYSSIIVGLPTETEEEANRTVEYVDSLPCIDSFTHNLLTIYRGTPLYDRYRKYGYKIEKIGGIPLFGKMHYPDDVPFKIKISAKSQIHRRREQYHRTALKTLGLQPQRRSSGTCFQNVIVVSDRLSRDVVGWMKEAVVINAPILQLYSSRAQYQRYFFKNSKQVYRYLSPSTRLHNFYWAERHGGREIVSSYSIALRDEETADHLKAGGTAEVLSKYTGSDDTNFGKMICNDETAEDTHALLRLLKRISRSEQPFAYLAEARRMPHFSGLCRWSTRDANCQIFETALIDGRGDIRLCWQGKPVGTVRDSFQDLRVAVERLQSQTQESRNCATCEASDRCVKCAMTDPISSGDYCSAVKSDPVGVAADLLRCFHFMNEHLE
jgi:radical SAM superfamily enzyme YgiQ (UPF0313 family)